MPLVKYFQYEQLWRKKNIFSNLIEDVTSYTFLLDPLSFIFFLLKSIILAEDVEMITHPVAASRIVISYKWKNIHFPLRICFYKYRIVVIKLMSHDSPACVKVSQVGEGERYQCDPSITSLRGQRRVFYSVKATTAGSCE